MALFGLFRNKKPVPVGKEEEESVALAETTPEEKHAEKLATQHATTAKKSTPQPTPAPSLAVKPGHELTSEERYEQGMALFQVQKYDEAFPLLKRVCPIFGVRKNKYPDGQAALAWMYENGCGTEAEDIPALNHYKIAARNGNKDGIKGMVRLVIKVDDPIVETCQAALEYANQSEDKELRALISTLEQKLAEAQRRVSVQVEQKKLKEERNQLFQDGVAAHESKDYVRALSRFEKAAQMGHITAQFNVGLMYFNGVGTDVNKTEALKWYMKAAEQGHTKAQCRCGMMYANGYGTAKDDAAALMWYQKAAEQGDADGYNKMGAIYELGLYGIPKDKVKALKWYEMAAEKGHGHAQLHCAVEYLVGETVPKDLNKALMWAQKAYEQDVPEAKKILNNIEEVTYNEIYIRTIETLNKEEQ